MPTVRLALANLAFPASPEASVTGAEQAIAEAARLGALVVCFPECYVPGYRTPPRGMTPPPAAFLEAAWQRVAAAAKAAGIAVVLGTERTSTAGIASPRSSSTPTARSPVSTTRCSSIRRRR
jgi:predicted amidohydrolase